MAKAKRKQADAEDASRNDDRPSSGSRGELGDRLRSIRRKRGWTLDQASGATGVARSTLSKIENGTMSPTFDLIQKLAQGLSVDLVQLFGGGAAAGAPGRRSLMLHNNGPVLESSTYSHALLAADLSKKRMLPFLSRIKARSLGDFSEMNRHQGDVFLYVVNGEIEFYSEYYSPVKMSSGQSIYFDGQMEHALVSISQSDAEVLWVCDNWSGQNDIDV
ncbi:MAG: helix-turn-helix transcriptional regulator [Bosea sp.]|uniref:helix-turn-helix domain-containing protein n=1 Tax=Bosea sp. (in: a-proteobacteria) TaxID=1871050 RepID=UPI001AD36575|nr:XRE family transcriptional regulator [Bosea sp. (in: a-proteobacteria)]MBN9467172.1 helix-turn-helix transcriptional regulator [Bosea sp. (in: a-proteobacteria)]